MLLALNVPIYRYMSYALILVFIYKGGGSILEMSCTRYNGVLTVYNGVCFFQWRVPFPTGVSFSNGVVKKRYLLL